MNWYRIKISLNCYAIQDISVFSFFLLLSSPYSSLPVPGFPSSSSTSPSPNSPSPFPVLILPSPFLLPPSPKSPHQLNNLSYTSCLVSSSHQDHTSDSVLHDECLPEQRMTRNTTSRITTMDFINTMKFNGK